MIAMTIGLFMLTALASLYLGASNNNREIARTARQIEDGRYAMQVLQDDVSLAGYYGYFYSPEEATAVPDPCATAPAQADLRLAVQGYSNVTAPAAPLSGCLAAADVVSGTDVLVVRRADSLETASGSLVAAQLYLQANADTTNALNPIIATGTLANFPLLLKDNATRAPIRKMHVHIYHVAPCSVPAGGGSVCTGATDDNGRPIPTLKRKELTLDSGGTLTWVSTPIAEGVEDLQIDYGVDTDGDGVPDGAFTMAPATATDWFNVVALNVHLLVRNTEPSSDFTDRKTYSLGLAGTVSSTAVGGTLDPGYRRKAYNGQIRIVNIASRREQP
jgi:type IV pilus assembly protein PilW